MHRIIALGLLFFAGCESIVGPFQHRKPERVDDPLLTISEQQARGRDRLALPDNASTVAPRSGVELPR